MTIDSTTRPLRSAFTTIALVTATLITFQVLAGRVAAERLHLPFGGLVLGNALFGLAVAGAVLAMWERNWRLLPEAWSRRACLGFLVSLPLAWSWLVVAPMPVSLDAGGAWLHLTGFAIAGALPFAFGGAAVGVLLGANARAVHGVLGAALFGGAAACTFAPLALEQVGIGGSFLAALVLAMAAAAASGPMDAPARAALMLCGAAAGFFSPRFDSVFRVEGGAQVSQQEGQPMLLADRPIWSRWSPAGRTELFPLDAVNAAPAVPAGEIKANSAPPATAARWWLAQTGERGAVVTDYGTDPTLAAALLNSDRGLGVALQRGRNPKVCLLGLGGGAEAIAALQGDAAHVRAIEADEAVIALHATAARAASRALFDDSRMEIVHDDPRAALLRSDERFDVLELGTLDTWSSLHGGAVALLEDPMVTVPACATMVDRLADGGILQMTRAGGGPETVRLLNNLWYALGESERTALAAALAVVRGREGGMFTVLYKKGGFKPADAARLREIADGGGIATVVVPDGSLRDQADQEHARLKAIESEVERIDGEIQRRNEGVDDKELQRLRGERAEAARPVAALRARLLIADWVLAADKPEFAANCGFDIAPTSDDRPYFFDLARGGDVAAAATPWVGGDVSRSLLRWQLLLGIVVGVVLLGLPMLFRGGAVGGARTGALRFLLYFLGFAAGCVAMELALMQKLSLLLGPRYWSTVVTLAALFAFSGVGAVLSHAVLTWEPQRARLVAIGLFASAALVAFLAPAIVDLCVGLSMPWRIVVTAIVTAPIGMLLGMPLPHGIRVVERVNPSLVPWSIAVTAVGFALGTAGATALALAFGYAALLFAGGVTTLVSLLAIDGLARASAEGGVAVEDAVEGGEAVEVAAS